MIDTELPAEAALTESQASVSEQFQRIRIENVLSRFPIHVLSKKGEVNICITRKGQDGDRKLFWKVMPNPTYGKPRALAYKLDTLVINRRIDEIGRPVPELVRLGSLRDIARDLDLGGNTNAVKTALRQNAHAVISAKLHYTDNERQEQYVEFETTRYGVIFSGETMPTTGHKADAVYITLNAVYRAILNSAPLRPLDYAYLKRLSPAPQRFYEVISVRIFATLKAKQQEAKLRYSDYCIYSAQKRSLNWDNVRPQMREVHRPHLQSGYLKHVRFESRPDSEGNPDWMMFYTPGPKAKAEYAMFSRKEKALQVDIQAQPKRARNFSTPPQAEERLHLDPTLLRELTSRGIAEPKARHLLLNLRPEQHILDQIEWGEELVRRAPPGTFRNPPGLLISFIEMNLTPPSDFESTRLKNLREEAQKAQAEKRLKQEHLAFAYKEYQQQESDRFIEEELEQAEYKVLFSTKKEEVATRYRTLCLNPKSITELAHAGVRSEVMNRIRFVSFEEFCAQRYHSDINLR